MKKTVTILLVLLLAGCVTKKETYLIITSPDKEYIPLKTKRDTTYTNRFEKQFIEADSVFTTRLSKLLNKNRK